MKIFIALALAILTATATAATKKATLTIAPTAEEVAAKERDKLITDGKTIIMDRLKDPESARFRGVYIPSKQGNVCGEVNSKNSMGGYVGFQHFLIEDGRIFFDNDGPSFPSMIAMACTK